MQSTFLSQIVDASINGGITLGFFYIMTAIVQLLLGKFSLFFFCSSSLSLFIFKVKKRCIGLLVTTSCLHLFASFGALNLCSVQIQTILALNKVPDLYRFKIMEMLEETEMMIMPLNGLILLFILGILCLILSIVFWIIVLKNFFCIKSKKSYVNDV
jgi:hypothetical protein